MYASRQFAIVAAAPAGIGLALAKCRAQSQQSRALGPAGPVRGQGRGSRENSSSFLPENE